jgi:hypothetical protein
MRYKHGLLAGGCGRAGDGKGFAYSDLKIYHFIGSGVALIAETESVLSGVLRREDKVALSLFRVSQDNPIMGSHDFIVDLKLAARLNLRFESQQPFQHATSDIRGAMHTAK